MANIEEHYKHVFVHHYRTEDELVEVNPKYVYMMIPTEYVCVYHKLLVYLADFGKALLSDCSAACRGNSKTIVDCWNMFQSALACKALGRDKEAQLYIDYIKAQLKLVYKGTGKEVYDDAFIAPLDRFGHLHGIVSCGDVVKFMVDPETGELLEQTTEDADHVFVRDDEEVIPPVEEFTLRGTVNPADAAIINYLGTYTKGTKVAVSFTIKEGYELEKITTDINKSDIEGDWMTDPQIIVTMNKNSNIIADFKKKVEPEPEPEPINKTLTVYKAKQEDIHNSFGNIYIKIDGSYKNTNKFNTTYEGDTTTVEAKVINEEGYNFDGWYSYGNGNPIPDNIDHTDLVWESDDEEINYKPNLYANNTVLLAILKKKPIRYKDYYIHCADEAGDLTKLYGHFDFAIEEQDGYSESILEVRTGGTAEPSDGVEEPRVCVRAVKDAPSNLFVGWYKKHHIDSTTKLSECTLITTDNNTVIELDQITDDTNTRMDFIGVFKRNFIKYKVAVWSTASKIIGAAGRTTINVLPNLDSEPGGQLNHSIAEGVLETNWLRCQIYNLDDDYETIAWRSLETEDTSLVPDPFIDMRQHSVWHIEETGTRNSCIMYLVCNVKKSIPFDLAAVYDDLDPIIYDDFQRSGKCKLTYIATKEGESKDVIATGINRFSSYSKNIEIEFIENTDTKYEFIGWYYKDVNDIDNEELSKVSYDEVLKTYKRIDVTTKTAPSIIRLDINQGIKRVFKAVFRKK